MPYNSEVKVKYCLKALRSSIVVVLGSLSANIHPLLDQCWSTVYDAGPTVIQQWVNVSCLLGRLDL